MADQAAIQDASFGHRDLNDRLTEPRLVFPAAVSKVMLPGMLAETVRVPVRSTSTEEQLWSAALESPVSWLSVESPQGNTPDDLALQFDPTGPSGAVHQVQLLVRAFAIQGNAVRSYSLADGTPDVIYQTAAGTSTSTRLIEQPILFNDRLVISSESKTWIFNLEDGEMLQTLEAGGRLSYSNGYLLAAGNDGTLRAFIALNGVPTCNPEVGGTFPTPAATASTASCCPPARRTAASSA